jgi:hypothetical protein
MPNDAADSAVVMPLIAPTSSTTPKSYAASIYQDEEIAPDFAEIILELEKTLELKIWLLIQNGDDNWDEIKSEVYNGFRDHKTEISKNERTGLLLHSLGGDATAAYKIVRLFQRRTTAFMTIVPLYAKSAATLMALGGKEIVMGMDAELGPLDVQIYDEEKEEYDSALNAVQSLERLNAHALTALVSES